MGTAEIFSDIMEEYQVFNTGSLSGPLFSALIALINGT